MPRARTPQTTWAEGGSESCQRPSLRPDSPQPRVRGRRTPCGLLRALEETCRLSPPSVGVTVGKWQADLEDCHIRWTYPLFGARLKDVSQLLKNRDSSRESKYWCEFIKQGCRQGNTRVWKEILGAIPCKSGKWVTCTVSDVSDGNTGKSLSNVLSMACAFSHF